MIASFKEYGRSIRKRTQHIDRLRSVKLCRRVSTYLSFDKQWPHDYYVSSLKLSGYSDECEAAVEFVKTREEYRKRHEPFAEMFGDFFKRCKNV